MYFALAPRSDDIANIDISIKPTFKFIENIHFTCELFDYKYNLNDSVKLVNIISIALIRCVQLLNIVFFY